MDAQGILSSDNLADNAGSNVARQRRSKRDTLSICEPKQLISQVNNVELLLNTSNNNSTRDVVLFLLVLSALIGVLISLPWQGNDGTEADWDKFRQDLQLLKQEFPGQDKKTWTDITLIAKSILTEEPSGPAVLLFVSHPKEAKLAQCLAQRAVAAITGIMLNSVEINEVSTHYGREYTSKGKLYKSMQQDIKTTSAFLLFELETLPGAAAIALHGFCDEVDAPFKQAVIALTLSVEHIGEDWEVENSVKKVLKKLWSSESLDEDRLASIFSIISRNIVRVRQEEIGLHQC